MVSFILPGNSATGGYEVANSCRFNDASSDYLNRTPSSAGNQRTFTISFWYKRTNFGGNDIIISTSNGSSGFFNVGFIGSGTHANKFFYYYFNGSSDLGYTTDRLFRDVGAWYHIVVAIDTTQGTESNREKLYINGVEETTTATYGAFTQNLDTYFNDDNVHYIGYNHDASSVQLNGYLAEVVNIDGSQLDATSFGKFDSDSPTIWKPIDVSGLTFGTNGFYLDFENSGSLGADVSGNSNNFTVNNLTSVDQSTDTCTNNFATLNPLDVTNLQSAGNISTFSEGNLSATGNNVSGAGTIGVSQGKWYFEVQNTNGGDNSDGVGFYNIDTSQEVIYRDRAKFRFGRSQSDYGATWQSAGDIIGVALDLDNTTISFYKNGSSQGNAKTDLPSGTYVPLLYNRQVTSTSVLTANFGSPPYSISSGNSDANGYGNFEYSVPSGYYALNTKNLAEFG